MSATDGLEGRSAADIGRAIAGGLDPVEVAEFFLDRIAAAGDCSVFTSLCPERGRAEAEASRARHRDGRPAGPLDGVPLVWKDLIDVAGTPTTAASALFRDSAPVNADAPIVANATAAGMVSLGKTNLTELAFSGIGLNPHYGTPVNPFDAGTPRVPGGSSSGSAVAVARGLVPLAVGSDTGGSVRVPAAFNGLTGYKSSEGRISKENVIPLSPTLDTIGPLCQSVEDCFLIDAVLRGTVPALPPMPHPSTLRVIVPTNFVMEGAEEAVLANYETALGRLADAGVSVERHALPMFDAFARLTAEHGSMVAAEAYWVHAERVDGPDRERIDRRVVARIEGGKRMTARNFIAILQARRTWMAELHAMLGDSLLAMPTVAHVAPPIAALEADDELFHATNLKTLRNTMLGNFFNLPGLAMPTGTDAGGMPTSILFSARGGRDDALLAAGRTLEMLLAQS